MMAICRCVGHEQKESLDFLRHKPRRAIEHNQATQACQMKGFTCKAAFFLRHFLPSQSPNCCLGLVLQATLFTVRRAIKFWTLARAKVDLLRRLSDFQGVVATSSDLMGCEGCPVSLFVQ